MKSTDRLQLNQQELVKAWRRNLPGFLETSDKADIQPDEADPEALRIHIDTAGRTEYSFDFICKYLDSREVKVNLVDAEKNDRTVDESRETVQHLIEDYMRHIHECAQSLHELTHG